MNLKEIEAKIEETKKANAGAWIAYANISGEGSLTIENKAYAIQGWLVGLGMAKGIGIESRNENVFQANIQSAVMHRENPKTPYEQGIKEALEWCIKKGGK